MRATKPVARFVVRPRKPSLTDTIELLDCSVDPKQVGIAWRAWDFGDGATSVSGLLPCTATRPPASTRSR